MRARATTPPAAPPTIGAMGVGSGVGVSAGVGGTGVAVVPVVVLDVDKPVDVVVGSW